MYRISKRFSFSAAHCLPHLSPDHPCARPHGHNYEVEMVLEAERLDGNGFVVDFRSLDCVKKYIDDNFDHTNLNDFFGKTLGPTTSENIARFLFRRWKPTFPQLALVRVSETAKTWAEYSPSPEPASALPLE